jgi:hypothetical protein
MRNIVSPLDGIRSPFGRRGLSRYAIGNFDPALVADFDDEYYRANSSRTTFDGLLTHSRLSNATMVDSDGLIKWGPHNLALNSASPATQSITVISGADYTVECTGVSIVLSGAGTSTVTEGNPVEITASTTTLTLTVTGSTGTMWCYRSDLGGMVNNPDRGDSYVPTTSSAVYLPRRNHYGWNGSSYVNKGLLLETESRTNLEANSNTFTTSVGTTIAQDAVSPDESTNAWTITGDGSSGAHRINLVNGTVTATGVVYAVSVYAKAGSTNYLQILNGGDGGYFCNFDLSAGTVGTSGAKTTGLIESVGGNYYRCTAVFDGSGATLTGLTYAYLAPSSSATYGQAWTTSGTLIVYGAQLEAGSTPSSYIPTSGATVTRTPDILTIPSANLPWPTPRVIGPELVISFQASDFTAGGTNTVENEDGAVKVTYVDTTTAATISSIDTILSSSVVTGSAYLVSVDVKVNTGSVTLLNGWSVAEQTAVTSTDYVTTTFIAVAKAGTDYFQVRDMGAGEIIWLKNFSVKEINPLAVSIQMDGRMTYADTDNAEEVLFLRWAKTENVNEIELQLRTSADRTGEPSFLQRSGGVADSVVGPTTTVYTPGTLVPFNIASRHGSTFINGAVDGTALTADLTPVALPDLSATNLSLAYDYMGTIRTFRVWANDLGDSGIEEASTNA